MGLEYFANDKYKVLYCMAERQIPVKEQQVVKLSQQEIADIVQLSKVKVNSIISDLKSDGYIAKQSSRGKYVLTPKAKTAIADMQNGGTEL